MPFFSKNMFHVRGIVHRCCYHKISKIFPPVTNEFVSPTDQKGHAIIQQLLHHLGIISNYQQRGLYAFLPIGERSLRKLKRFVDGYMDQIDAQKVSLPTLISDNLWKQSGRLDNAGPEVMKLLDRHNHSFILSPTHEESITYIVSQWKNLSYNSFPLRLYQMSSKFRDEPRVKFGLIRAREFLMKDLYTFDVTHEDALTTYKQVLELYEKVFRALNLNICKAEAPVGVIGGNLSHEFHILSSLGEDRILRCQKCNEAFNSELEGYVNDSKSACKHSFEELYGIEIGHSFCLGTRYSSPLSATFNTQNGTKESLHMGCYGIGLTRLLGAALEVNSQDGRLIWPKGIEPYKVCIIPPKRGSKESSANSFLDGLVHMLSEIPNYKDDVVVDDRINLTIGRRLRSAKIMGYPLILVIGRTAMQKVPRFELIDKGKNVQLELTQPEICEYVSCLD